MGRQRTSKASTAAGLLTLAALPLRVLGWWLRSLAAVRHGRFSPRVTAAVAVLLTVEAVALGMVLRNTDRTIAAAAIIVCLASTLAAVTWLVRWCGGRRRLRIERFESLLALTPSQFEGAVADLLHDLGYRAVRRVGGAGDLGADVLCRDGKGRKVAVQCKRHAPGIKVGSGDVQSFIGMVTVHHAAARGIFVTTSTFTAPALALARRHEIRTIDGPELSRLIAGSRERTPAEPASLREP